MLASDRAEAAGGESDFSADDGMGEAASPASQSLTPSLSASPPPPPVSIGARWASDLANLRRNIPSMHCRVQAVNSAFSYSDSESCPQCRERYAAFRRNNSVHSAATVNSYTGSSQLRKDNYGEDTRKQERKKCPQKAGTCPTPRLQRMQAEDEDSCPVILERDFHSLHRNVPALRRRDVDTSAIRQHYYPEGGWGWIICGVGFIVHLFTTGLQLSFGLLYLHALHHTGDETVMDAAWLGPTSLAVSLFAAPVVVAVCRRKSTRLTAILGGLVMALGCLFTSFAHQLHQIMLSYGIVMGVGVSMVRETSSLMLGHYFKRRREFVEMVSQAGAGVGITLISVFYKEAVGKLGWRLGLQAVTGVLSLTFFLGILYRSASLYHPQRRAIIHLKNQKKKIKEKKGHRKTEKPPLLDFSPLRIRSVQILLLSSATAAFGVYTPVFYLALQGFKEGLEHSTLVLLETFLGFATALGCVAFGLIILRPSENCLVSRQYLCQASMIGIGISLLALSAVQGYHGYALFVWLYGICLGGFLYSLKMFTMERVKARHFTKTWGFVQGVEAIPVLLGVPIAGYINQSHPKAGYYFSCLSAMLGAALLYFVGIPQKEADEIPPLPLPPMPNNNPRGSVCICPAISPRHFNPRTHIPKSISFATTLDLPDPPFVGCMSDDRLPEYLLQCQYLRSGAYHGRRQLRSCKSVPEGLARCDWQYRNPRDIQVIEQMTTSV